MRAAAPMRSAQMPVCTSLVRKRSSPSPLWSCMACPTSWAATTTAVRLRRPAVAGLRRTTFSSGS